MRPAQALLDVEPDVLARAVEIVAAPAPAPADTKVRRERKAARRKPRASGRIRRRLAPATLASWRSQVADRIRRAVSRAPSPQAAAWTTKTADALELRNEVTGPRRTSPVDSLGTLIRVAQALDVHPLYLAYGRQRGAAFPRHMAAPGFMALVRQALRAARQAAGVSTPSLAAACGVPQSSIVRWESGEYENLDVFTWDQCLEHLGTTWDAILVDNPITCMEEVNEHDDTGEGDTAPREPGDDGGPAGRE